jgi:hypothetical protein
VRSAAHVHVQVQVRGPFVCKKKKKPSRDGASPHGGAPRHGASAMAAPGRANSVRARRLYVRGPRGDHLSETGDSRVSGVT